MDKLAQELKNKADKSALPYHNVSAIKYEVSTNYIFNPFITRLPADLH